MTNLEVGSLTEIIDIEVLQEVQDKFAVATGLASVIADKDGNEITKPSCFSQVCRLIRSTPEGLAQCRSSDANLGMVASQTKMPVMAQCHAGLVDLAAPIIVNGVFLGSVLCGQILIEEMDQAKKEEMAAYLAKLNLNDEDISELLDEISVETKDKFSASTELLHMMAKYIVSIGLTSLNERLISQKNLELMQEEASRIKLENELKTMELKALQSQVNPHFLFNTLNTIVRLAMIEGASETEKVSYALSQLLRYTLRKIEQSITLKDEIDHVKEYLTIQEYRYGNRLKSHIEISETAGRLKLPAMTLQPLVENAIVHGLEPKIEGGTITIKAQEDGGVIRVVVEDDGIGMSEKRLREIGHPTGVKTGLGHTTGIGFSNVMKRLQHHFGEGFSYAISSSILKGTKVELNCPLEKEVGTDV